MGKRRRKAGSSPVKDDNVAETNKKKKRNRAQSVGTSGCTVKSVRDDTATNVSDIGDFGGSAENINEIDQTAIKIKLPPLVVKEIPLEKLVSDFASMGVAAEYKLSGIGTKVMLQTKVDYNLAAAYLKNSKAEFFTHDIPGEKPFKVVIRGLPNYDPKLIATEIKDRYKLTPIAIYQMKRRNEDIKKYQDCLFLVHFQKGTVTLNTLKAIRSLFSIIIRWEPYRGGRRDVTQCQRCLNFGHGTRNCHIKPRCNICAKGHVTSDCPASSTGSEAFKCANCGGNHQGSDRQCPQREAFKHIRKRASIVNQPRKKEKQPAFRADDFPPLRPTQLSGKFNARDQSAQLQPSSGTTAGHKSPSPPNCWRSSSPTQPSMDPEKYSADELLEIFSSMTNALRECRNKPEQISVLGKFIIQYGS